MFSVLHPITDLGTAERIVAVRPLTAAPPRLPRSISKASSSLSSQLFAVGPNLERVEFVRASCTRSFSLRRRKDRHMLTSSRPLGAARHLTIDRHSAVIGKQLDWVVEAADRIFADAFEIEIAFDEVGERAGQ